jgi:hypothetical protein
MTNPICVLRNMSCFEQRETSGSDNLRLYECERRSHLRWRPCSNNWTAASKNPKPSDSNSKLKRLSVAPKTKRFREGANPTHSEKLKQRPVDELGSPKLF